jgi:zinc transporter 2
MFSDLSGFMISIFSIWIAKRASTPKLSYGYHRSEVIGALASIFIIWALTVVLLFEATTRIIDRTPVENPAIMLITATAGLVFNIVMAKILHSAPGHSHHGCDHGHSHGDEHAHGDDHKHEKEHAHKHDNHDHAHSNYSFIQ